MIFALKALLAGLIIAFSSWLAGQNPRMAGFIIALPMASLIAIAFVYFEHNNVEKTILYAKSILIACLLYTSPSPRDVEESRMPSSA